MRSALLIASLALIAGATQASAATQAEPLDLRQSYSGFSFVDVGDIETFNTYANGFGTTNSLSFDRGYFSFDDPFLKSSANPPLLTFFMGVSSSGLEEEAAIGAAGTDHLILALTSSYAAGLLGGGQDFTDIFPGYSERSLIDDLVLLATTTARNPGDDGYDALQMARSELVNFASEVESRDGFTPAAGGPFTLLAFSTATDVGQGNSTLTPEGLPAPETAVPEPGLWAMMIAGMGGMGIALRRRRGSAGRRAGRVAAAA